MQHMMCSNGTTGGNAVTNTRSRRRRRRQRPAAASISASAALVVAVIAAASSCCALAEVADSSSLILRGASTGSIDTSNAWNGRPTSATHNAANYAAGRSEMNANANADTHTATVGASHMHRSLKEEDNAAANGGNDKNNEKDNNKNNEKDNGKEDPAKADKNNQQNVAPPTPRPTIMPTSSGDTTLTYIGEGGMLGTCQGDCDSDVDCQRSLRCFQRNGFESVPNCNGFGTEGTDYCACFDDEATLTDHSAGAAAYFVNGAFSYLQPNGVIGRSASCTADFDLAGQTNYQDFVDACSRPLIVNGQISSRRVRDLCRFTCGVCVDIPPPTPPPAESTAVVSNTGTGGGTAPEPTIVGPPPTPRPTKRPTNAQPTYGDRDPTPYPTLTPWPTVTAWPTVTMWPTVTAWPTVTMWPTVTAYPTVTFYPTAEADNPNAKVPVPTPAPLPPVPPGSPPITAAPVSAAPVTPFPTAKPTISMAPTRYYPAMTVEVSVATQVAMFTTAGGHIRVGNTKWTRADYLLDAIIYSTSKMLEERLDGLVVEDYLDDDAWQDDDQTAEIVAGQRAELDFADLDDFDSTDVGEEGDVDGYRQRRQRMLQEQQRERKLVDRSLPNVDDRVAYMAPETAPHGSRRLIVEGIVLELNWDKSTISHVALESLLENPDLSKNDKKALNGLPGISWQKAYLRYWIYAADSPNDMISQKKTARISRKVEKTVQAAMDDGDFLAWAQYADPKIAGLSLVGLEHEAPINVLPLPISPYATPIATGTLDPIRIAGMALFIFALVGSFCISKIAIRRRRKREARALWGSLETDKDIDALLNVGLIMPESTPGGDVFGVGGSGAMGSGQTSKNGTSNNSPGKDGSGNGSDDAGPVYSPQVLARQMNRSELGYSKDNSMLMGGYQRTMQIAVDEEEEGQQDVIPPKPERDAF